MATPQQAGGGTRGNRVGIGGRGDGAIKREKFDGRKDELSGYVFGITNARNSNNYSRTLKEIAWYAGSTSKFGGDLKQTIETETAVTIPRPRRPADLAAGETDPDAISNHEINMDVYQEDIKGFVKQRDMLQDNMGKRTCWCGDNARNKCGRRSNHRLCIPE